jgi:RNA polymerase sigma-70 factor (ECF subfamily)
LTEEERRQRRDALFQRREALTEEEVALLREEFGGIIRAHEGPVRALAMRRLKDPARVDDVVQDAFTHLFNHIVAGGFPHSVPAWLLRVTDGLLANAAAKIKRDPASACYPSSGSMPAADSGPDMERTLDLKHVGEQALDMLDPRDRLIFEMCVLGRLSHADVAAELGMPLGTVKTRVKIAQRQIMELIERLLPPSQRKAP